MQVISIFIHLLLKVRQQQMFLMLQNGSDTIVAVSCTLSLTEASISLLSNSRGELQVRLKQLHVEMLVGLPHLVLLLISFV